jgi:hypothetical protein
MRWLAAQAALLGLLLAIVASCKSEDTSDAERSGPAGTVLSVEGEVEARRGDEAPRALEGGSAIYADDVISTGPAGAVRIRLSHNEAIWELGADERRRVDDSLAWRAPKGADTGEEPATTEERSLAAGRHAEDESADTSATVLDDVPSEALADEGAAEPPAPRAARSPRPAPRASAPPAAPAAGPTGGGADELSRDVEARQEVTAEPQLSSLELQQRVMDAVRGHLRRCFDQVSAQSDAGLAGRIEVGVRVGRDGRVEELELEVERGNLPGVAECAQRSIRAATIDTQGRSLRAQFTVGL